MFNKEPYERFSYLDAEDDTWLSDIACADVPNETFFVKAGHVIDEDVLNICRACPVRINCLRLAYDEDRVTTAGYFGGLSPGQRRNMTLEEAEKFCATDLPTSSDEDSDEHEPVVYI